VSLCGIAVIAHLAASQCCSVQVNVWGKVHTFEEKMHPNQPADIEKCQVDFPNSTSAITKAFSLLEAKTSP
jgi:hypothetical protein